MSTISRWKAVSTTPRRIVKGSVRRNGIRPRDRASPPSTRSTSCASPRRASITSPPPPQLGPPGDLRRAHRQFRRHFRGRSGERMGLAAKRLVIATNANDIMARALNDGVYAAGRGASHAQSLDGYPGRVAISSGRCSRPRAAMPTGPRAAMERLRPRQASWSCRRQVLAELRARYDAPSPATTRRRSPPSTRLPGRRAGSSIRIPRSRSARCAQAGFPRGTAGGAFHRPSRQIPRRRDRRPSARRRPCRSALSRLLDLPEKLEVLPNKLSLIRQFISSRLAA